MKNKDILDYHSFYLSETQSSSYKEFIEKEKIARDASSSFDLGETYSSKITFCDICSNEDITKIIKKLYNLPRKFFVCEHRFKKPSLRKKYCYVHLNNGSRESGIFAEVKIVKDKYLQKIDISWSQINNYYALLEYNFVFQKSLSDDDILDFVNTNINSFTSKDFHNIYYIKNDNYINYSLFNNYIYDRFIEICQHYITTFFYSRYGKNHLIPYIVWLHTFEKINLSSTVSDNSGIALYNREKNYILFKEHISSGYQLISQNGQIPSFSVSHLVMRYGIAFYYSFFGGYEINLFNYEFTRYTSHKRNIPYSKLISLLNRSQGLKEEMNFKESLETEFNEKWDLYYSGKKEKPNFDDGYYKDFYNNSFDYFRNVSELYTSRTNRWIAICALMVSIASLVVAIIALFCK